MMKYLLTTLLLVLFCTMHSCKNKETSNTLVGLKDKTTMLQFIKSNSRTKTTDTIFTTNFTLNQDKYLSVKFTLEKPLVQSLQELAPNLSVEELLNKGNFQFSILVDDQTIYVENLNKRAGLTDSKTKQLTHIIPLIHPEPLDFWGWFMWLKFMKMAGGRDVLDTGSHKLTIQVRPYINNNKLKTGPVLAKGNLNIKVNDLPFNEALVPIQDIVADEDLALSKEHYNRTIIKALNKKIAQGRFENINGIVVLKKGDLLLEEYFNGSSRESLHDARSVGKTIASSIMGIAISEGHIKDETRQLKEFYNLEAYNNYSPKKENVTLKSLLTMSSGFVGDDDDFNNIGNEEFMYPTNNWVKFALDLPMDTKKVIGKDYSYFTAGVVILGDILHNSVPKGLVNYADEKLFKPLNVTNYKWEYTPQKVGNTAGGIRLRAIDFAKYGQLYKNQGQWNDQQIIPEAWVKKSLSKHVKQPTIDNGFYGYLFWNKTYLVNGKNHEVSFCTGNGGNKVFIFKNIPFVIVITASAYNLPYAHADVDKMMTDYILPAIINP